MKVYFHAGRQPAAGYGRIIAVHNPNRQSFSKREVGLLTRALGVDVCFPAPDQETLLIMSRHGALPTIRRVRKVLGRCVGVQLFRGGIFNPYLPVRPYDAWFD